jgi:predicted lipoprotein with Yx(FWY)xxD motif
VAALVVLAAALGACSNNVGGSQQSVARPGNAKGKGIITGGPSAGAGFPPSRSSSAGPSSSGAGGSGQVTTVTAGSLGNLGKVLIDGSGHPLYLRTKDHGKRSGCSGSCAQAWPPVTTGGAPHATGAAKSSLLGTTTRKGRTKQVTYAGHPLYRYARDDQRGAKAKGEGRSQYGSTWYAVSPRGTKVRKPGS